MPSVRIYDGFGTEVRCDSSIPAVIAHFCAEWMVRFSSADISVQPRLTVFPLWHEMTNPDGSSNRDFQQYPITDLDQERSAQLFNLFRSWQEGGNDASQDTEAPVREVPSQPRRRRQRERDIAPESAAAGTPATRSGARVASDALRALNFEYSSDFEYSSLS